MFIFNHKLCIMGTSCHGLFLSLNEMGPGSLADLLNGLNNCDKTMILKILYIRRNILVGGIWLHGIRKRLVLKPHVPTAL